MKGAFPGRFRRPAAFYSQYHSFGSRPPVANRPPPAGNAVTWTIPIQVMIRVDAPVSATPTPKSGRLAANDPALAEALAELEAGRSRPYYDADADATARDEYYRDVRDNLTNAARYRVLSALLHGHSRQRLGVQARPPRLPVGRSAAQPQAPEHLLGARVRARGTDPPRCRDRTAPRGSARGPRR